MRPRSDSVGNHDGCAEVNDGAATDVGFVGTPDDVPERLALVEEGLDEMAPFSPLRINPDGFARRGCCEMTILARRRLWPAMMDIGLPNRPSA
ncbi:hypothetical protein [Blastochloris sulfoviridis]|uniref:Uncharacterized protein n=1 Tax=Blastochloris sulfoviridis TaxID=50712 RepID=A0A5M6HWM3_9HYPH|nr:hypothetical protein [Blastochloris sulfoviridis]KAA5599939.1 hypothetical protein F1193_11205 [Blastochloris sulfoviridis]